MTTAADATTGRDGSGSLDRLARGGSANLVGSAAGALLALLVVWLITNGVDQSVAGSLFAATSVFLIVSALAELGSDISLAKFLPHYLVENRRRDAVTVTRIALAVATVAGLFGGAAFVVFRSRIAGMLAGPGEHHDLELAIIVLAAGVPVAAVMNTALSATRGLSTVRPTVLVDRIGRNLVQVLTVGVAVAAGADVAGLTTAWVLPYAVAAAAALGWLVLLFLRTGRAPAPQGPAARPRRELLREYAAYTWPRAVSRVAQSVLQRADIVLVAALRSPAEAAVYTVATRFLVIGQLGTQAIQQVVAPQISQLLSAEAIPDAKRVVRTATAWTMAVNWPMFLIFIGVAPLLLGLFGGEAFQTGDQVVVILSVAAMAAAAGGSVDLLLLMAGRSGLSLVNSLVSLAVNLAVNLALIPTFGMTGAAIAWASAIAVRNVLGMVQVRRSLGWLPFSRSAAVVAGLSGIAFAVPALVLRATGYPPTGVLVALLVAATGTYVALLWRFREVLGLDAFLSLLPHRPAKPPTSPPPDDPRR